MASGNTNAKFKFIITLTGDHIKDACEYSDVLFTKGTGIIYLKDGESKTVSGIPAGTTYSVSEEQTGLYQSRGENTSGIIEKDQMKEVSFTNTELKDNPPAENTEVNVTVSKKVLPEKNKETGKYQMSAAFTGLRANTSYGLSNGTEFTSDANGNGYTEFTLAQDEELVFLHLPVGCTYQFTEAAGDYTSSYEVTDDQSAGTVAKNTDRNTEEKKALSTGKETAEAGENVKVTFTNEIQYLQKLTLEKKTVKADGSEYDCKESFDFTITFSNLKPGQSFASTVGKVKADEDGNAGNTTMLELPSNVQGLMTVEDMGHFQADRYYTGKAQKELFEDIITGVKVTERLTYYGITFRNSTLVYGEPGTGKTEFAKYVAYKLGLPYAYINFTYLIESYMGNTSKNLQRVFDFCKGQKCVLMLDEIDCIGLKRENGKGCDGELARTTIALMQCLDNLVDGQVVIAATNRADRLDPALLRRFHNKKEFNRYNMEEELAMITQFVDCIDILEMDQDLVDYSTEGHTQAETMDFLTNKIAKTALEEIRKNKSNS